MIRMWVRMALRYRRYENVFKKKAREYRAFFLLNEPVDLERLMIAECAVGWRRADYAA